jgi:hypothetical protein
VEPTDLLPHSLVAAGTRLQPYIDWLGRAKVAENQRGNQLNSASAASKGCAQAHEGNAPRRLIATLTDV